MGHTGIIGGGASGLMAAVAAARAGESVTILERRDRIGKKILATGNGRCNLSNRDLCVERDYRSHSESEVLSRYFAQFGVEDTLSFFENAGLLTVEKNGYLYPRSLQASAVLELLRSETERLAVEVVCPCRIREVKRRESSGRRAKRTVFLVSSDRGDFRFDSLILACGSAAGTPSREELGGFELAKSLGLTVYETLPALTGLRCRESFFKSLAGVRCRAKITLLIHRTGAEGNGKEKGRQIEASYQEEGELQLADYGISGIPVFQCSRYASIALSEKKKVEAVIDFVPEYEKEDWQAFCRQQYQNCLGKSVVMLGSGILHKKLVQVLLNRCGLKQDDVVGKAVRERIFAMFALMRAFEVEVVSTNSMESAQVCTGGVAFFEVDEQLQAKKVPGLYLCGEMLDVDGRCGGYNLQWAWSSGHIAGGAAAGAAHKRTGRPQEDKGA